MPPGNSMFCCSLLTAVVDVRSPCLPDPAPDQRASVSGGGARTLPQRPCRTNRPEGEGTSLDTGTLQGRSPPLGPVPAGSGNRGARAP
eukprot:13020594-Heterocapsa_arctica.AAC.1